MWPSKTFILCQIDTPHKLSRDIQFVKNYRFIQFKNEITTVFLAMPAFFTYRIYTL